MSELSDEILMKRVKDGDLADLAVLFERYHVKMFNFLLKVTFDRTVSQDLTQNIFYRIIKYRHTYSEGRSFKSWIYQLARNVHVDYCSQKKKISDRYARVEEYNENIAEEKGPYGEEEYEQLDKALSKLNPDQKEIIILSRYQGLKYEEISSIRNQSVPAIKVQMFRAIKQLRQFYLKQT